MLVLAGAGDGAAPVSVFGFDFLVKTQSILFCNLAVAADEMRKIHDRRTA
jgi:hypothetical protein